jgi:hypothetical protein
MDATEELEEPAFDVDARRLCPDDTCTGLIGPDGRCKVCGAVSPDGPPAAADAEPARPARRDDDDLAAAAGEPAGPAGEDAFDPDARVLCPDDTCTGLIGPDGTCKVCGAKYQP